jgi:hypothetical protein
VKFRAVAVPVLLLLVLSGCAPEPVPASPSPSPSTPAPSIEPSASPTGSRLVLPEDCDELVPLEVIHEQFSPAFEPIFLIADSGDADAQSFAARNGITCLWGIPNSDAGFVTVYAAVRGTDTDEQQVTAWRDAGFAECPPFLDACYFEDVADEIGEVWTAHVLVEGYELRVQATSNSLGPLLVVAREASTNMGYL